VILLLAGCGTFIVGPVPVAWDTVVVADIGDAQVLDARSADDYAAGHIPGAANVHWTELTGLDEDDLWDARPAEELAALFAARGLSSDEPIVVYGSGPEGYGDDGNAYWALRYLGHDDVRVLNGGWASWLATGGDSSSDSDGPPPATFEATVDDTVFATTEMVAGWGGALLDVRSEEEWLKGHIPGAVWMNWTDMFADSGALLTPEDARARLDEVGISPDAEVIVYCAGGIRAGHTFMVLDALGYPEARNYVGSWARWTGEGGEVDYP
jgi:thiosulfate/3-mercaptopyruvate sulfurtransferase